jgi:branched-subunit amino acid transport protein AzlD
MLGSLNGLPSQLFKYETAEPWSSFTGTIGLGFVLTIPLVLLVLGMWLALGAMRRRAGIPMLASDPSGPARNEVLTAGFGLAGIMYAVTHADALIALKGIPRPPATVLNAALPAFAGISDILVNTMMIIAATAIPFLVVAALTPRWSLRALCAAGIMALLGILVWSAAPPSDVNPAVGVTVLVAVVTVVSIALVVWGSRSAWSWIVGALAYQVLGGLHNATYGPVWQARVAGALTLVVTSVLIALIARRTSRAVEKDGARPAMVGTGDPGVAAMKAAEGTA